MMEKRSTCTVFPHEERSKVKGMGPERSDIIIPGVLILITIMDYLKTNETVISDYGLLEGLLTGAV